MKKLTAYLIAVLLGIVYFFVNLTPAQADTFECSGKSFATNPTNGHKYCLTSPAKWTEAEKEAVVVSGHLVTVNDQAEQDWLVQTFGNTNRYWIGLTDQNSEGNFKWVSGEQTSYANWLPGEPNDGNCYANEDYAVINGWGGPNGGWNDLVNDGFWQDCSATSGFCGQENTPQIMPPMCESGMKPIPGIVEITTEDVAEKEAYCEESPIKFTVRSGDVDGFGFGDGAGLIAANKGPANANNSVVLSTGNFLPSLNKNTTLATGSGDDFDNRSGAEITGTSLTGTGFVDKGSKGSQYTDISLSTSYGTSQTSSKVFQASSGTFGQGGAFPGDGNPKTLSNQPGFEFNFEVDKSVMPQDTPLFFNLVFGDYDVKPANVKFTDINGNNFTKAVKVQPTNQDGAIQAAFIELNFNQVFKEKDANTWSGFLKVDFVAPSEPFTAFDFAEIGTQKIAITSCN